jgi:isochorismate synthase EntC
VVGWAGGGRAELLVALRSALLRGNRARVFAGAGIVQGSTPDAEWEETELKARALLEALGASP